MTEPLTFKAWWDDHHVDWKHDSDHWTRFDFEMAFAAGEASQNELINRLTVHIAEKEAEIERMKQSTVEFIESHEVVDPADVWDSYEILVAEVKRLREGKGFRKLAENTKLKHQLARYEAVAEAAREIEMNCGFDGLDTNYVKAERMGRLRAALERIK